MKILMVVSMSFLPFFSMNVFAQQTLQFDHKIRKQEIQKSLPGISRTTIAIARVNDLNAPTESSFDDQGKQSFSIEEHGEKKLSVYSSSKTEAGFAQKTREILSYYLSKPPGIQLIERENINSLLREWEFSESKYVKRTDQLLPGIEIPDLIATGFLSYYPLCDEGDDIEEEAWGLGDEEEDGFYNGRSNEDEMERRRQINANAMPFSSRYAKKKAKSNFYFLMRVYETRSSRVKFIACGEGKNVKNAIKHAVNEFGRSM